MDRTRLEFFIRKPPALNNLYGITRHGKKYLTDNGRVWKDECVLTVKSFGMDQFVGPVSLLIHLYTCRQQDNDGILKILMDSLEASDIIKNDYWIFDLRVVKHPCKNYDEGIKIILEEMNVKS